MMTWQRYELIFRLLSPMHIGWRKSGNLQQCRGYVPGKNLWAGLTARLTRDAGNGADGQAYVEIGKLVTEHFRFPYLYPSLKDNDDYTVCYPWPRQEDFDYLFLDSYTSAALDYPSQSAAEGLLHETEFVAPHTRHGHPVFLTGSLYVHAILPDRVKQWQSALARMQFGGERGYGWGRMRLVDCVEKQSVEGDAVRVEMAAGTPIRAHLKAANATGVAGPIEPVIGWERNNSSGKANWRLSQAATICYAPGAIVTEAQSFTIEKYGIWASPVDPASGR